MQVPSICNASGIGKSILINKSGGETSEMARVEPISASFTAVRRVLQLKSNQDSGQQMHRYVKQCVSVAVERTSAFDQCSALPAAVENLSTSIYTVHRHTSKSYSLERSAHLAVCVCVFSVRRLCSCVFIDQAIFSCTVAKRAQ